MAAMDEQILRTTKEIVVKFIETGRISPVGFPEAFRGIYSAVKDAVQGVEPPPPPEPEHGKKKR